MLKELQKDTLAAIAKEEFQKNENTPVKLNIKLIKISNQNTIRYFNISIGDRDVTSLIAGVCGYHFSQSRKTPNTLIAHGNGMDMAFSVQHKTARMINDYAGANIIDSQHYNFIPKEKVQKHKQAER